MSYPSLKLFYFETCPYCIRVMDVISDLRLKVEYCNTRQSPEFRQKLIEDTGRSTVPCLYIDGRPMHESRDIMEWLQLNQDQLEKIS